MCQLIARKLERIALNDRADVAGLKEGLRGEGKLEDLVSIFFLRMKGENICEFIYFG